MIEPQGILGTIVERKRRDVEERLGLRSLAELRQRADPTAKSLRASLARPGARFIMEIKRVSPSAGRLAEDVCVAEIATQYRGAADAISVLTDEPFFGGSLEDLRKVRGSFDGPILAKDFIVDPRQVAEARIHGADAVLVMLSVLEADEARAVIREAERLGMDALVEVHDEQQLELASRLGAKLIGINNRDLRTLKVDLSLTERLAPLAPRNCTLVAESGIRQAEDVRRLSPLVDAFLIGSSLMRSSSPALQARELTFGRVKICGITSLTDLEAAADAGASYCGMIFVAGSPRAIGVEQAKPIARAARARGLRTVGVFRDGGPVEVSLAARSLDLDIVQLHGSEDSSYMRMLRSFLSPAAEIWAAEAIGDERPRGRQGADRILFDTRVGGRSGGTGRTFDWRLAEGLLGEAVLAGGLGPSNIRDAASTGAWALDVGSLVEDQPGVKDPAKLKSLFEALRPLARNEVGR